MMPHDTVLASIINWRRPENLPAILRRYREQSVPLYIALVECAPNTEFAAPPEAVALADIVFTVSVNCGACSRFIPPLMLPQYRYCYFGVDDHLPGRRHIECLLRCAEQLDGRCATIGQDGRWITRRHGCVKRRVRPLDGVPRPVDVVTSSELMETKWIADAVDFMRLVYRDFGDPSLISEDDLILCMAVQQATGCPSYITPQCSGDEWWAQERLPSPHALSGRPDHAGRRKLFVLQAMRIAGWRPHTQMPGAMAELEPQEAGESQEAGDIE